MTTIQRFQDPGEVIGFILMNHPEAVYKNCALAGYAVDNVSDFYDVVNELVQSEEGIRTLVGILDVPTGEALTADEIDAINAMTSNKTFLGMDTEDWVYTLGGLASVVLPMILGGAATGTPPTYGPSPSPAPADNTMNYLLIGGAVLLVVIVAIVLIKRK